MIKYMLRITKAIIMVATIASLSACSDDDLVVDPEDDGLELKYVLPQIERYGRYYAFQVETGIPVPSDIEVVSDAGWLKVSSSILPEDGIVEILTSDNLEVKGRTAHLTFTAVGLGKSQIIEVYQRGEGDSADNGADMMEDFCVGWGFNAFDEYQSRSSVRGQIINVGRMGVLDSDSTFQSVQEVIRGSEEFEIISAFSMQEMSNKLTKKMEQSSNFLGVKKTVQRIEKVCSTSLNENYLAYARLYKVVASKSIDRGAIEYLVATSKIDNLPFTDGFKDTYQGIMKADKTSRPGLITKMLETYGTHLIVEGLAGGSIDYVVTFDRKTTYDYASISEEQCKKVFGKSTSSSSTSTTSYVTSSISNDNTFSIAGGSEQSKKALKDAIKGLSKTSSLPNEQLQSWLSSIYYSQANKRNLDVIDFTFIPIWNLFSDAEVSNEILKQIAEMASTSNNEYTDKELGVDNYEIDLTKSEFTFPADGSGTLVKVLYRDKTPIMEICSEYVPKIRTDRRITMFYPINNGRTNHGQGLFPGDRDGNRPAFVSFYQGQCYVEPIENYGYYDQVTKAYYMHGNLYERDFGIYCRPMAKYTVVPHQLQFNASNIKYDVVKIGSGYWTRCCIKESMAFGSRARDGRTFTKRERIQNYDNETMLFACIADQTANFLNANASVYGSARDKDDDLALTWYLPTKNDKEYLTEYIGNNTKPLFKGGATGFDAQFHGYHSTGTADATDSSNCYIAFKEPDGSKIGYALILKPNYTWTDQDITDVKKMFPVRCYRSRYYTYPTL
ncbi:MAG: hypothetical protein HFJ87_09995 [Muribaculaceae bacterium]|nr:hypothetical protein [Muribaculaceae bacterium]